MHGGAADRSGLIHVGDEVIEVNGINVEGKTPNDVLVILVRVVCVLIMRCHLSKLTSFVFLSKIQKERLRLNWCHRMVKVGKGKVKFAYALISTMIRRAIRTYRAKKLDSALSGAKYCILFHRYHSITQNSMTRISEMKMKSIF